MQKGKRHGGKDLSQDQKMKHRKPRTVPRQTHKKEQKNMSFGKRTALNITAALIAIALLLAGGMAVFEVQRSQSGFDDKDTLITTYFTGLDQMDKRILKKCFYPTLPDAGTDIQNQLDYAASEIGETSWKPDNIQTEWTSLDTSVVQEVLSSIQIEDAAQCIAFVPLEQKLENGITVLQEDVYQFYVHQTREKWYIAAFQQTARNVTGGIKEDGTKMTDDEINEWLTSLAAEIGSDTVGYLLVDNYWQEVENEETADDEQIKTYITSDYSSYLTMSVIKDTDVEDFHQYSADIIQNSKQEYGDIITSSGMIGTYETDVQIAQNEETGARIIVWIFKTDEKDGHTHVITLESLSEYDASTYINTFHLEKQKKTEDTSVPDSSQTE